MKPILNSKMRHEIRCILYNNNDTKYTPKEYQLLGDGVYNILTYYLNLAKNREVRDFYYVLGVDYDDLLYSTGLILDYFGIELHIEEWSGGGTTIKCIRKESKLWDLKMV